jgi:integrase
MATYKRRGDSYTIRWRELVIIANEDGTTTRRWRNRRYTVSSETTAKRLLPKIEAAVEESGCWKPESERATVTMERLCLDYVRAAVDAGAPLATQRFRSSMINGFLGFVGDQEPASSLSLSLLDDYAASLPSEGRKAHTRHRKLLEVERMWAWAHARPELFPGVPTPRKLTGRHADNIKAPPPVFAWISPTWEDIDAMIGKLLKPWHRRLALLLRFTGLRVSQALRLDWRDVDLDRRVMLLRAGTAGAKRGKTRALPIHKALAAEMAGWGVREGLVFQRPDGRPWRGDAPVEPFRRAWRLAEVDARKWGLDGSGMDLPGQRAHARPTHAFRATFTNELRRACVQEHLVLYLTGHSRGGTIAAYAPEGTPEESARWSQLVEAVGKIPAVTATSQVIPLEAARP